MHSGDHRLEERVGELARMKSKLQELQQELTQVRDQLSAEEAKLVGVTGGISQQQEESLKGICWS